MVSKAKKKMRRKSVVSRDNGKERVREEIFLPVSSIRPDPKQPRDYFDEAALEGLARSIERVGLLEPISVIRSPDGKTDWMIDDGERRWRIHKMLGREEIRSVEIFPKDSVQAFMMSVASNFCREGHTPLEIAAAIERFRESGLSISDMTAIFGKSDAWVRQHDNINKLHPKVRAMMDPRIPRGKRLKVPIVQLLASLQEEDQITAARQIVEGNYSLVKARTLVRQVAHRAGVDPYKGNRHPGRDFNQLVLFAERLSDNVGRFVDMPGDQFDSMFDTRSDIEIGSVATNLEVVVTDLQGLLDKVKNKQKERSTW